MMVSAPDGSNVDVEVEVDGVYIVYRQRHYIVCTILFCAVVSCGNHFSVFSANVQMQMDKECGSC